MMADQLYPQAPNPADVTPMAKALAQGMIPDYLKENTEPPQFPTQPGKMPAVDPMNPLPWMGMDLASMGIGTGAKAAGAGVAKAIMAGPLALTADKALLSKAQDMAAQKLGNGQIFRETGWYVGSDGKWRFEIPDTNFSMKKPGITKPAFGQMDKLLKHPEAYEAYPELKNYIAEIATGKTSKGLTGRAVFEGSGKTLPVIKVEGPLQSTRLDTGIHELQHAVQHVEDYAPGANYVDIFKKKTQPIFDAKSMDYKKLQDAQEEAYKDYARHAGEVEARNATTRLNMNQHERAGIPPLSTVDTPALDQVVRRDWHQRQSPEIQRYIKLLMGPRSVY